MDHILEHEGQSVPDLQGVSESAASASGGSTAMDVDDDNEDAEALASLGVVANNAVEAKVRRKRSHMISNA